MTTSFGHETEGDTNVVKENARQLQRNLDEGLFMVVSDIRKMVEDNLEILVYSASKINNFAKFTLKM